MTAKRYLPILLLLSPLATAQIYKWVDDQGQVRYSDQAPDAVADVELLAQDRLSYASGEDSAERLAQIRAVADRLSAERKEREAQRQAERALPPPAALQVEQPPLVYAPEYLYPYYNPHAGRRHHNRYPQREHWVTPEQRAALARQFARHRGPVLTPRTRLLTPSEMLNKLP